MVVAVILHQELAKFSNETAAAANGHRNEHSGTGTSGNSKVALANTGTSTAPAVSTATAYRTTREIHHDLTRTGGQHAKSVAAVKIKGNAQVKDPRGRDETYGQQPQTSAF